MRYIFCITTGRSGTHYLTQLLSCCPEVFAGHEEPPVGSGNPMFEFLQGKPAWMRQLAQDKANVIKAMSHGCAAYAETNHCFIKGFGWFMPGLLGEENLTIITLYREKNKVINSFLRNNTLPVSRLGHDWLFTPDAHSPIPKPGCDPRIDPRPWLEWSYDSTYAMGEHFREQFPKATYLQGDLEDLNCRTGVEAFFSDLELSPSQNLLDGIIGTPTNTKR